MALIRTAKEARARIGEQVWWDHHSSTYIFLRSGIVNGFEGRHILIDHNWLVLKNLRDLRTTEEGGAVRFRRLRM